MHGAKIQLSLPLMSKISLSIPKGTRDFSPSVMKKRQFIFQTIRSVFELYGFEPLETPSMENYDTLTGKYGQEGDQLLFKILNNGDYLKEVDVDVLATKDSKKLVSKICERALRYDLTIPFARYVAMHHAQLTFPFKRYQIQPVWRADRPQKGRYREFYQCDVDIIGTDSLWSEVDLIKIYDRAFALLGLKNVQILINNRKLLAAVAELCGCADRFVDMTIALDKLDKIGWDGVSKEMLSTGFSIESIDQLKVIIDLKESNENAVIELLAQTEIGKKGVEEWSFLSSALQQIGLKSAQWAWDLTLARGLNYYTGFIFEVKAVGVSMGSIGGGGRYDDLTGIFGLPNLSGVGISFGADRIFDVMEELNLFPLENISTAQIGFAYFSETTILETQKWADHLRSAGLRCEVYPELAKMKKQFKWADDKHIPYMAVMGDDEMKLGKISLKNLTTGEQSMLSLDEVILTLQS
jgi:histidyl-tRNA synthetase